MPTNAAQLHRFVQQLRPQRTEANGQKYPKLTVVTPSYNQSAYLERTILSVLNQQYPNLEYFIIDGGSTDGSVDIIRRYERYLAGWVSEKDNGQTDAINKGFKMATGEYVAFQNSDDVYAPDAFRHVAKAWQKNPNVDVFFGDMYILNEHDLITESLRTPTFCAECQVYEGMQVFNQSLFIRRKLVEQHGYLDESLRFVIDYEIICRLGVLPNVKFQKVAGFWGGFRLQPDAKTSLISETIGQPEHRQVSTFYSKKLSSGLGAWFWLRYCRWRKLLYFFSRGQFGYMIHRLRR